MTNENSVKMQQELEKVFDKYSATPTDRIDACVTSIACSFEPKEGVNMKKMVDTMAAYFGSELETATAAAAVMRMLYPNGERL